MTVDEFLALPLVAHAATSGPTVRPVWFLWDGQAFWWLTGPWSALAGHLDHDPAVALVVDTCDRSTGTVLQVTVSGHASVVPLRKDLAERKLAKYLGSDPDRWPRRSRETLDDPGTRLVTLRPDTPPALRNLSYEWPSATAC